MVIIVKKSTAMLPDLRIHKEKDVEYIKHIDDVTHVDEDSMGHIEPN